MGCRPILGFFCTHNSDGPCDQRSMTLNLRADWILFSFTAPQLAQTDRPVLMCHETPRQICFKHFVVRMFVYSSYDRDVQNVLYGRHVYVAGTFLTLSGAEDLELCEADRFHTLCIAER